MLLAKNFIKQVLHWSEFKKCIMSIIVNEAHVVSHWGQDFWKLYDEIGVIRAFLPCNTPMVALSATLTPHIRKDVMSKLSIGMDHVALDIGNDHPNMSLIVHAMEHPSSTFADLNFVIPDNVKSEVDVPSTWVFVDSIVNGVDIGDHLNSLLPAHLRYTGLVQPYNAVHSQKYHDTVMDLFKAGTIRVLICTDAAGMVCADHSLLHTH